VWLEFRRVLFRSISLGWVLWTSQSIMCVNLYFSIPLVYHLINADYMLSYLNTCIQVLDSMLLEMWLQNTCSWKKVQQDRRVLFIMNILSLNLQPEKVKIFIKIVGSMKNSVEQSLRNVDKLFISHGLCICFLQVRSLCSEITNCHSILQEKELLK
jgi:hypothetical protein